MPLHFWMFKRSKFIYICFSLYDAGAEYDWWRKLCISFFMKTWCNAKCTFCTKKKTQFFFYVLIYPLKCLANTDDKNLYHLSFVRTIYTQCAVRLRMLLQQSVLPAITFVQCRQMCCPCMGDYVPPIGFGRSSCFHVVHFAMHLPKPFHIFFLLFRGVGIDGILHANDDDGKKGNWKIFVCTKTVAEMSRHLDAWMLICWLM